MSSICSVEEIPKINVRETLSVALGDCRYIRTILDAMRQESKGVPIEVPPEDLWDRMIYAAQKNTLFSFADPRENTPEKLVDFVRLPRNLQQKILYRCVFVYQLCFTFGGVTLEFPLKFENLNASGDKVQGF